MPKHSSFMESALSLAADTAATAEEKLELVRAAMALESRRNRFLVSWCLNYMKFPFVYLGRKSPDAPPKLRDRVMDMVVDDPGSGVEAALNLCETLVAWSMRGGLLALEHPEAGMDEGHIAPMCDLLVALTNGQRPWERDLLAWAEAGAPSDFDEYLPEADQ